MKHGVYIMMGISGIARSFGSALIAELTGALHSLFNNVHREQAHCSTTFPHSSDEVKDLVLW